MLKNITAVLIGLLLVIGGLEVYFRIFQPYYSDQGDMFEPDSRLGWRFIPNHKSAFVIKNDVHNYVTTNEMGFRDYSFSKESTAPKKIFVFGDSFVSNVGVLAEDVFTEVLQSRLERTSVLNFGVNGYGQVQQYLLAKKILSEHKPSLLIFVIFLHNDFTDNIGAGWVRYGKYPIAKLSASGTGVEIIEEADGTARPKPNSEQGVIQQSHLYHFVKEKIEYVKSSKVKNLDDDYAEKDPLELVLCFKEISVRAQLAYQIMKGMIKKIDALGREKNTPVLFVLAPSFLQVDHRAWKEYLKLKSLDPDAFDLRQPARLLKEFAEKEGLDVLDLSPRLISEKEKGKLLYHEFEQHWTSLGNQVVADEIYQWLHRKGMV